MAIAPSSTTTASYKAVLTPDAVTAPTALRTPGDSPATPQTTPVVDAIGSNLREYSLAANLVDGGAVSSLEELYSRDPNARNLSATQLADLSQRMKKHTTPKADPEAKPADDDEIPLGLGALETGAGTVAGVKALSWFKRSLALRGLMAIRRALRGERRPGEKPVEEKPVERAGEKPTGEKPTAEMTDAERAEQAAADLRAGNTTRTDLEATAAGGRVVKPVTETAEALDVARAARTLETVGEIRAASSLTRLMKVGGPIALISFAIPAAVYASVKAVAPAGADPTKVDAAAGYAARYAGFTDEDAREQWRLGNHGTAILKEAGKMISDTAGFLKRVVTEPAQAWADAKKFGADIADLGSKLWNNPRGVAQSLYAMGVAANDDALKRQAIDVASTAGNGTRPDTLTTGQDLLATAQNNPELVRATQTARAAWTPPTDHNVNYRGALTPPAAKPDTTRVAAAPPVDHQPTIS